MFSQLLLLLDRDYPGVPFLHQERSSNDEPSDTIWSEGAFCGTLCPQQVSWFSCCDSLSCFYLTVERNRLQLKLKFKQLVPSGEPLRNRRDTAQILDLFGVRDPSWLRDYSTNTACVVYLSKDEKDCSLFTLSYVVVPCEDDYAFTSFVETMNVKINMLLQNTYGA